VKLPYFFSLFQALRRTVLQLKMRDLRTALISAVRARKTKRRRSRERNFGVKGVSVGDYF
jgi:hypothetical protein